MVAMKDAVAKLLIKLAGVIEPKDASPKIADRTNTPFLSSSAPHVEAMLTAAPVWGADEARAVAAFFHSPAGQLFSKRVRSVAAHVAIEGAKDRAHTVHSAGVSAGWNECVRYVHSLATVAASPAYPNEISRVSGDQDTARAGLASLNDSQQPEDEAALIERLSP
ncbi:MAG TPA: hypothetical protein VGY98_14875 [Verrucomicrobiae bacterium]|nr:hypothetical protein [Verrucomicrobiae bacterium]